MSLKDKTQDTTSSGASSTRPARHRLRETGEDDTARRVAASPFSIANIRSGALNSLAMKIVLGLLIFIFAIGFAISAIGPGASPDSGLAGLGVGATGDVATVGTQQIERARFENAVAQQARFYEQFGQGTGPTDILRIRQQTLQTLADQAALVETAKKQGLEASEAEVDKKIDELLTEQIKGQQTQLGPANFRRQIESQFGSEKEYRSTLLEGIDRDAVAQQVLLDKLEKQVKDGNKVGEADYKRSQTKLLLRQLVVRPKLPAPTSKDPQAEQEKNAADAGKVAARVATDLKANATTAAFTAAVKKYSDDVASKVKGGLVGWKLPAELPYPPKIQEEIVKNSDAKVIGPVQEENTKDYYIFFIENRAERLPADYAKNKAKLLKEFETQKDNEVWTNFQQQAREDVKMVVEDPALRAFQIQNEELFKAPVEQQDELRQQALNLYEETLDGAEGTIEAAVHYQMAQLYQQMNKPKESVEQLRAATANSTRPSQIDLELARALRVAGNKPEALTKLNEISKNLEENPSAPSPFGSNPDDLLRTQVAAEYEALGDKQKAEAERKKIAPPPAGMPGMGGMGGIPGLNIQPQGGGQ